jgi:hypothetical protein
MMMMRTSGGICKRCRNEIKGRERKKKKGKKQDADPDPDHRTKAGDDLQSYTDLENPRPGRGDDAGHFWRLPGDRRHHSGHL